MWKYCKLFFNCAESLRCFHADDVLSEVAWDSVDMFQYFLCFRKLDQMATGSGSGEKYKKKKKEKKTRRSRDKDRRSSDDSDSGEYTWCESAML